jgi:hypothetical protein
VRVIWAGHHAGLAVGAEIQNAKFKIQNESDVEGYTLLPVLHFAF